VHIYIIKQEHCVNLIPYNSEPDKKIKTTSFDSKRQLTVFTHILVKRYFIPEYFKTTSFSRHEQILSSKFFVASVLW
jgi:hypothetical protein